MDVNSAPKEGSRLRILVTGHAGYIGSVLTGVLRNEGHDVVGLDCDFYHDCDFGRVRESISSFDLDIRDVEAVDLIPYDAVIHLAALPDSAWQHVESSTVLSINEQATIRLAESCKKAGVPRFLFASTWKVYGCTHDLDVDEDCPPHPITPDATMKLRCEDAIAELADESFATFVLRHGEVYGMSPRMRLDVPVNDFVASALTTGTIQLAGDGRAWLPVVHVDDIARAYAAVVSAPDNVHFRRTFNLVANEDIYREIDIADSVTDVICNAVRRTGSFALNEPSCRVSGASMTTNYPGFQYRWTLSLGIQQLCQALGNGGVTLGDWRSDRYRRVPRLRHLIENGGARDDLRPTAPIIA